MHEHEHEKLQRYTETIQKQLADTRNAVNQKLFQTFEIRGQENIRRLSWSSALHYRQNASYRQQVREIFKDFVLPYPMARSYHDAYHHHHLISACLLAIIVPQGVAIDEQVESVVKYAAMNKAALDDNGDAAADPILCYEMQLRLYSHLLKLMGSPFDESKETLSERVEQLEKRVTRLEAISFADEGTS